MYIQIFPKKIPLIKKYLSCVLASCFSPFSTSFQSVSISLKKIILQEIMSFLFIIHEQTNYIAHSAICERIIAFNNSGEMSTKICSQIVHSALNWLIS